MIENIGKIDRVLRILLGLVLLAIPLLGWFGVSGTGVFGLLLVVVSIVLLVTAVFGFCPLYRLLGTSTRES